MSSSPSLPSLPPPTVTPAAREPHWQALAHDLNWMGLWTAPSSAIAVEVARLEARLHNPNVTDHFDMIDTKARLDAYRWLRETVDALATKANDREREALVAASAASAASTSTQRRSRWQRAADYVLPPVIG